MTRPGRATAIFLLAAGAATGIGALASAWAQAERAAPPPSNAPSPAETNPLPTTTAPNPSTKPGSGTAAPTPQQAPVQPPQQGAAPVAAPATSARPTLVPDPGTLDDVDEVTLPAKPAAILSGTTKWESAVPAMKASFQQIEADLAKAGIAPAGRPIVVFVKTEEDSFQYEAMIPIAAAPAQKPTEAGGLRFGSTPSGKALRFRHSGSYDEIDGTYETLTAYLDAKEASVKEQFVEEYVTDLTEGADEKLDVNIYALRK